MKYYFIALFIFCLWGCESLHSPLEKNYNQLKVAVAEDLLQTKSLQEGGFTAGSELGLFVVEGGNYSYDNKAYNNYKYTASGSGSLKEWNPADPVYLSSTLGKAVAYYPYLSSVTSYTSIPVAAGETDYMYSGAVTGISNKNPKVNFTMKHALSCFRIKVKRGSYPGAGVLSAVSIQSGSFGSSGLLNAETGTLSSVSGIGSTLSLSGGNKTIVTGSTLDYDFLVVPGTDRKAVVIKLTIDGKEYSCTASAPASTLKQGGIYSYTVTMDKGQLSFSDIEVENPGYLDEDGNLIIDVGGYKVRIGGNTAGIAFSYRVATGILALYAVAVDPEMMVKAAELSPATGGTFSQTEDDTSKTITLSNLNQDVWILFDGVEVKKPPVTYTLNTNQGSPDVYVDGEYIGTANSSGRLTWTVPEYDSDKTITLQNVTVPDDYVVSRVTNTYCEVNGSDSKVNTVYNGSPGETIRITNMRYDSWHGIYRCFANITGTLVKGYTSITINANSEAYLVEEDVFPLWVDSYPESYNGWNGSHFADNNSLYVTYGTVSGSYSVFHIKGTTTSFNIYFYVD